MKNVWPVKKLGEVAGYVNGYPFSPKDWCNSGLPIIRIQNLNDTTKEYNYFQGVVDKKYLVNPDDILISWSASLGVYIWNNQQAWLNQHIFKVFVNKNKINKDFFFYIMQTKIEEMKSKVHGGTMQHITKNEFEKLQIPVPSLQIQNKIVENLDSIRKTQELIDLQIKKTEELFESLLNSSFSQEKDNFKTLGDLATLQGGYAFKSAEFISDGVQLIRMGNVKRNKMDFSIKPVYLPQKFIDNYSNYVLNKSDIVISMTGTVGKEDYGNVAMIEEDNQFLLNQRVGKFVIKTNFVEPFYIYYFFQSNVFRKKVFSLGKGVRQANISGSQIESIFIPAVETHKQKQIVGKLNAVQEYKKLLIKQKQLYKELFDSVLDKCMKGKFVN